MKIVVTGGYGFIGSSFVNFLNNQVIYEVVIVDKLTYAANPNNIKKSTKCIHKDICDITLDDIKDADYIVNFAAESHVDNSISNGSTM